VRIQQTREELYELVWSKPMTQVAKDLGISDVMLGRICRERDIPRPQRGYWANLTSTSSKKKRQYFKPPLPDHSKDTSNYCRFVKAHYEKRREEEGRDFDWDELEVPIPEEPPEQTKSVDERVDYLFSQLPKLPPLESYKYTHPIIKKMKQSDTLKKARSFYSREHPIFEDNSDGKRLESKANGFLWTVEKLKGQVSVSGRIYVSTHFWLIGMWEQFSLYFHDPKSQTSDNYWTPYKRPKGTTIAFSNKGAEAWGSTKRGGKEVDEFTVETVKSIIKQQLINMELSHRKSIVENYEWSVKRRHELVRHNEEKRLLKLKRERERIQALQEHRIKLLMDASQRMTRAREVRDLVASLRAKQLTKGAAVEGFDKWSRWALQYAEQLDPCSMSLDHLEKWVKKF